MTKVELLMIGGERFEMEWEDGIADAGHYLGRYLASLAADREFVRATRILGTPGIPDLDDYRVAAANIAAWRPTP